MCEKRIRRNKIRRQRQLHRKLMVTSVTLVLVLICSMFLGNTFVNANSSKDTSFKYYTSVELKVGDTLWKIAKANRSNHYANEEEYIREVKEINHLKEDTIHAGEYLIIPYYTSEFNL